MPPGSSFATAAFAFGEPPLEAPRRSGGSRLMAFISTCLSAPVRPGLRRRGGVYPLREGGEVRVDHRLAREQRDDSAEGEERAERDRGLAALACALAGDHGGAHQRSGQER